MLYKEFLEKKKYDKIRIGFDADNMNNQLYDYQKYCVKECIKQGRFCIFSGTGTGKTAILSEVANQIVRKTNKPTLIVSPLAVRMQTIAMAANLGIEIKKFNNNYESGIYIINYENLHKVQMNNINNIILDEASIIKNFDGHYRNYIIDNTKNVYYKSFYTATPSPNDLTELGNYVEALGIMKRTEFLSKYFIHSGKNTSQWFLKKHALSKFIEFITTFALVFENPSYLGFDGSKFILPKLNINEISLQSENKGEDLFNSIAISAIDHNRELRRTIDIRLIKAAEIVNNSKENFIVWCRLNDEGRILKKLIPDAIEVKGDDSSEYKEEMLLGFAKNKFRVLITKPKIAQFGMNFQNCNNQIFTSLDYSFESLYQSIRRSWRYMQKNDVNIYIITTDTMQNVSKIIKEKEKQYNQLNKYFQEYYKGKTNVY
jgi:hypothetical protein